MKAASAHFDYFFFVQSSKVILQSSTFLRELGRCYADLMPTTSVQFTDGRCSKASTC